MCSAWQFEKDWNIFDKVFLRKLLFQENYYYCFNFPENGVNSKDLFSKIAEICEMCMMLRNLYRNPLGSRYFSH